MRSLRERERRDAYPRCFKDVAHLVADGGDRAEPKLVEVLEHHGHGGTAAAAAGALSGMVSRSAPSICDLAGCEAGGRLAW